MAIVSLLDVSLSFGGAPLLDRVNFQIERGERVCLVGRNGAGKSTLMKVIAGELKPDDGQVFRSPPDAVVAVTLGAGDLCVRDEGAGIAPEHMQKLFTRVWRGPGRRDSGAGLGLAICSEIAVAHGWNLSARNAEPGAEFVLSFAAAGA